MKPQSEYADNHDSCPDKESTMADRFFVETALPATGEVVMTGPDAHHMTAVRRFGVGDQVSLFCGDGAEYLAEILGVSKKAVTLSVLQKSEIDREPAFHVVIASALPKGDRGDFLLEKIVEVGATRWIPLATVRAVVVPKEQKTEKWQRAVIEASKQCGRNRLMQVESPRTWAELLAMPDLPRCRFVLHTGEAGLLNSVQRESICEGVVFAIGPEGGFSQEELELAQAAGWQQLSLGPRVLRVETAAVVVAAWATAQ